MEQDKKNVLIVSGNQFIIEGLHTYIDGSKFLSISHKTSQVELAIKLLNTQIIDLVIVDTSRIQSSQIEIMSILIQSAATVKIVAISPYSQPLILEKMIQIGFSAVIALDVSIKEFTNIIEFVMKGGFYLSKSLLMKISFRSEKKKKQTHFQRSGLTTREYQILKLISLEFTSSEIARVLRISGKTVNIHRDSLKEKLGAKNVAGIIMKAVTTGILIQNLEVATNHYIAP